MTSQDDHFPTAHLTFERRFDTSPARLWHLVTDAAMRQIWAAPSDDHQLFVDAADLREGGQDRHRCGPVEAPEYVVDTTWYRLSAPTAACFTETVRAAGQTFSTSLVTYGLTPSDAGTQLTISLTIASFAGRDAIAEHEDGWTSALSRLKRLSERQGTTTTQPT